MEGNSSPRAGFALVCGAVVLSFAMLAWAVVAAEPDKGLAKAATTSKEELARQQQQLAEKYRHFEEVILRMAELTQSTDPKRRPLLRRAASQSKDHLIGAQLEKLVATLKTGPLGTAVRQQGDVQTELDELLELLLSEQRQDRVKEERERIAQQIRKIKELINRQAELKGQTENQDEIKPLSPQQQKLAEETAKLAEGMQPKQANSPTKKNSAKSPADDNKSGDEKSGDKSDGDSKSGDSKKSDGKKEDGKKDETGKKSSAKDDSKSGDKSKQDDKSGKESKESKSGDSKNNKGDKGDKNDKSGKSSEPKSSEGKSPGKESKSQKSSPKDGQPSEGEPSENESAESPDQQQEKSPPGQKRVAAAQQKMEQAKKKLDDAKKNEARDEQEQAIRELEQAKAELEDILRQLREEELARTLAQLEQRFREMLAWQIEVYEGTKRLDAVPTADRGPNDEVESGRLSRKESLILAEADKALTVLRDEGSAVAFPEAVEMLRDDIRQVVELLSRFKVDKVTQGIEEDILAALEEMIAALQKAQKQQEQRQQQQQGGEGQQQEPPLVDQLAELKMIRALQMRVNTRTKRYQRMVDGPEGQADHPELLKALRDLAERELRILHDRRDIVVGKNK